MAVVALLKSAGASPKLTILIVGESLLNDGTAMVCMYVCNEQDFSICMYAVVLLSLYTYLCMYVPYIYAVILLSLYVCMYVCTVCMYV